MKKINPFFLSLLLSICFCFSAVQASTPTNSSIKITEAWVRASVPGQTVGAAYMTLTSVKNVTLVSVESSAADSVEIHNMSMNNGVMKMRMLDKLDLTAGKPYKLAPGGFHFMLFDLRQPLKAGEKINFTLHFKDKANKTSAVKVTVPVKADQ